MTLYVVEIELFMFLLHRKILIFVLSVFTRKVSFMKKKAFSVMFIRTRVPFKRL